MLDKGKFNMSDNFKTKFPQLKKVFHWEVYIWKRYNNKLSTLYLANLLICLFFLSRLFLRRQFNFSS